MTDRSPNSKHEPSIELHIEELLLHGFATEIRHRIAHAVERELSLLLTTNGVPSALATSQDVERIDGGAFQQTAPSQPESIGAQTARVLFESFGR